MDAPVQTYDAVVIGGGPAGLAGALYLARFRRSVLVVDAGASRAARIPRSHNVAGFEGGVPGTELLNTMRRQALAVDVEFLGGHVTTVQRAGDLFTVDAGDGQAVAARTLLLATGASDVEPPMPDVAGALVAGALRYCPVCDGYEVAGQTVGVVCDSNAGLREAVYLHHFTPQVQVFVVPTAKPFDAGMLAPLAELDIAFHRDPVTAIEADGDGVHVRHGGSLTHCDSLYSALGMRIHAELAVALGAALDDDGYVVADRHQQTQVPGLYVAGDVARGLNQISVGIGAAAVAAAAMHQRLASGPPLSKPKPPPAPAGESRGR